MQEKLYKRKKKLIYNIIFRLVTLVSIAVMIIFCMYLRKFGTLSNKTLIIIYVSLGITYLILTFIIVPRKFKLNLKIILSTILIIIDFIFVFSIRKIDNKIRIEKNKNEEVLEVDSNS